MQGLLIDGNINVSAITKAHNNVKICIAILLRLPMICTELTRQRLKLDKASLESLMDYFQTETIFGLFDPVMISSVDGLPTGHPITGLSVCRNDDLDLRIEVTASGWVTDTPPSFEPGEIRKATDELRFGHREGSKSIAKGVLYRGGRSNSGVGKPTETVWTYSAQSLELDCCRPEPSVHTIEWIGNVPHGLIWTSHTREEENSVYTHQLGAGDAAITLTCTGASTGGTSTLHLRVAGFDLYLLQSDTRGKPHRPGQIVYKSCPPEDIRNRIRLCLSFALGLPIIYYGHTDYSADWHPTYMRAYDAISFGSAMFGLYDLPPYPVSDPRQPKIVDEATLNRIVNAIYSKYDELQFTELSWAYWYAVCAPAHTAAVHFGGLIEKLQKLTAISLKEDRGGLLDKNLWRELLAAFRSKLGAMDLPDDVRHVLYNKVGSLNQLPQNIALKRFLERLGLQFGAAELEAWKHRNLAAHGIISENAVEVILSAKVLKLLFHRLLAAVTLCSNCYIDYYNLNFPLRLIVEAVPLRKNNQVD